MELELILHSLLNLLLVLMYFFLKAVSDKVAYHFYESIFYKLPKKYHWWVNAEESWKNKWKNGDNAQGEKFLGSSTIFVMFTDLWHFNGLLQSCIVSLLVVINFVVFNFFIDFFIYLVIGLLVFEYLHSRVFKLK